MTGSWLFWAGLWELPPTQDRWLCDSGLTRFLLVQPMDFRHYPFDSFDLMLELRFYDPTQFVDTTGLYGVQHPGVKIFPSSGGKKVLHAVLQMEST